MDAVLAFTRTNVYGTHVLLEAVRVYNSQWERRSGDDGNVRGGVERFVHVSTDEVYGDGGDDDNDTNDDDNDDAPWDRRPLAPSNPYAATKAAAEQLVTAYHRSYRLPVMIVRSNNVGVCVEPEHVHCSSIVFVEPVQSTNAMRHPLSFRNASHFPTRSMDHGNIPRS